MLIRFICLIIGYVFGLFQTSYLYGKLHGIDIREYGSGNAGTTNALRTLGKKAGAITFLGDCFKCIFAAVFIYLIFHNSYGDMIKLLQVYGACGVILGHNFPFYLKFKGGKGIAATAGMICSINWLMTAFAFFTFVIAYGLTNYVSVGSLMIYVGFMIEVVIFGQMGVFHLSQAHLNEMYIIAAFLTILAFWKHRQNIKRLMEGTENKTYLLKKQEKEKKDE